MTKYTSMMYHQMIMDKTCLLTILLTMVSNAHLRTTVYAWLPVLEVESIGCEN